MAFGKRSVVSNNIWDFSVGLIGESGVGKTTTLSRVCEKVVGSDGYILLDIGKEWGVQCIPGVTYEEVPDYKTWNEITKDIIKNKQTDYPNLKIILADTLDQLFEITEPEIIRIYNAENLGKKDFTPAKTINAAYSGFGRGEDQCIKLILDRIEALKKVGVTFWFAGHTKSRDIVDPLTGATYTSLTTNMMQRYFTAIKTKTDVLGVACIDREIIKEGLGRKDIITKKEITRDKVVSESRRVKFRDENYAVDSKSRFANIVSEIPLDADEFIKALQDAINAANTDNPKSVTPKSVSKKTTPTPEPDDIDLDDDESVTDKTVDESVGAEDKEALMTEIRASFKEADADTKTKVKTILKEQGSGKLDDSLPISVLVQISEILG